jgi:predicted CXXCH cytochrome family protein
MELEGGAPATNRDSVRLTSVVRGATKMRLAESWAELTFSQWRPYRPEVTVPVDPGEGARVFAVQFSDDAGNETDPQQGQVTITIDKTPPRLVAVQPVRGAVELIFSEPVMGASAAGLAVPDATVTSAQGTPRSDVLQVRVTGLRSGGQYRMVVGAGAAVTDMARNPVAAGEVPFTALDEEPPSAPSAIEATTSESLVLLSWGEARDDVGVYGYQVFRSSAPMSTRPTLDAALRGGGGGREFIDDSGVSNAVYYYGVAAFDRAGNIGPLSRQVRVRIGIIGSYHGEQNQNTNICKDCHNTLVLGSGSQEDQARAERVQCYACHNGTGSRYNSEADFGEGSDLGDGIESTPPVSAHPVAAGRIRCGQCHTPHRSSAEVPRLLTVRTGAGGRVTSGAAYCLTCHTRKGDGPVPATAHVDGEAFARSSHGVLPVADGTGVACLACHKGHSADQPALLSSRQTSLCLGCHSAANLPGPMGWDVARQFDGRSRHTLDGTTTDGLVGEPLGCSSCHDAHAVQRGATAMSDLEARVIDPATGVRWAGGTVTDFCLRCHGLAPTGATATAPPAAFPIVDAVRFPFFAGWDKSPFARGAHATAPQLGPAERECTVCHQPHGSDNARNLLRGEDTTEQAGMCLGCHDGSRRGASDIATAFARPAAHPTLTRGGDVPLHRDVEGATELGYNGGAPDLRHAECQDCHDVHTAKQGRHLSGSALAGPALNGAVGVNVRRWPLAPMAGPGAGDFDPVRLVSGISEEWQLCFKCHSGYTSLKPLDATGAASRDVAAEFNPLNGSFHGAVIRPHTSGRVAFKPGSAWTADSRINCTDCHGNDDPDPAAAAGPHGSRHQGILIRPFTDRTGLPGTEGDLCFSCHDRDAYGGGALEAGADRTGFADDSRNLHNLGAEGEGHRRACVSCHSGVVHGAAQRALLVSADETAPYRSPGSPGVDVMTGMPDPGAWTAESCSHEGACHRTGPSGETPD